MKPAEDSAISEPGSIASAEPSLEDWEPETDHDDSLIRWMLGLSPEKRLAAAQGFVDSVRILRTARRIESG